MASSEDQERKRQKNSKVYACTEMFVTKVLGDTTEPTLNRRLAEVCKPAFRDLVSRCSRNKREKCLYICAFVTENQKRGEGQTKKALPWAKKRRDCLPANSFPAESLQQGLFYCSHNFFPLAAR